MNETPPQDLQLLVLDRELTADLTATLRANGFRPEHAVTPAQALNLLARASYFAVLVDCFEQDLPPLELLQALRRQQPEAVIIIYTSHPERRSGPDRRLGDVFEFLEKDAPVSQLIATLKRAADFHLLKNRAIDYQKETEKRGVAQLEWLLWKQRQEHAARAMVGLTIVESIKRALTQGLGFGSLATQLQLLAMAQKKYPVPPQLEKPLGEVYRSADYLTSWMDLLDRIVSHMSGTYRPDEITGKRPAEIMHDCVTTLDPIRARSGHTIDVSDLSCPLPLRASEAALQLSFRELLINAMHFSPPQSTINVICFRTSNSIAYTVLNDILILGKTVNGVPREFENAVFEPFFRINTIFREGFLDHEFGLGLGLGLGLTAVQHAMNQSEGQVFLYEVTDHSMGSPRSRVAAQIIIPIRQE